MVSGLGLAWMYMGLWLISGHALPSDHLVPCLAWGLVATFLPWLILFPAYGWGAFGVDAPENVSTLVAPVISHLFYGLGLGLTLNLLM